MMNYIITVLVKCDTIEQAVRVAQERVFHDEDYGFDYTIDLVAVEEGDNY